MARNQNTAPVFDIEEWMRKHVFVNDGNKQILAEDLLKLRLQDRKTTTNYLKANGWRPIKRNENIYLWVKSPNEMKTEENKPVQQLPPVEQSKQTQQVPHSPPPHSFNLPYYISTYYEQLKISHETQNDSIYDTFEAAVAIRTKTVIYQDLPLKIVSAFEKEIDWEGEADGEDEEFKHPFISHLNPSTHTFVSSIISSDSLTVNMSAYGINMMKHIANKFKYNYLIVMDSVINKVMKTCQRNDIPPENVIILNKREIDVIRMNANLSSEMNKANEELTISENDINESTPWQVVPYIPQPSTNESETNSTITLRPYQLEYIQQMENKKVFTLRLPCGMGKSLIMIYHMMRHKQNSVILVPNIALINQFHYNIIRYYEAFHEQLPEIHRLSTKDKEMKIEDKNKQQIIVSVYNSFVQYFIQPIMKTSTNRTHEQNDELITSISFFPYLYIDEAHHVQLPSDKTQKQNIQYLLSQFNEQFNEDTEEEDSKLSFTDLIDSLPRCRKAFSNLIYTYGLTQCSHMYLFSATIAPYDFSKYTMFDAIEENYLCRLNVVLIANSSFNSPHEMKLEERIEHLATHISHSSYKSIIIYTSRVTTAKKIAKTFNDSQSMNKWKLKPITSAVISAKDNATYRDEQFKVFRSRRLRCLVTVNCISEGVDLPEADAAVFFDDRKSIINIIQCVGRIMRKHPAKLSSTFVIPIYKNDDIDILYKNILCVLNGELGYGTANLRRVLSVKYDSTDSNINFDIIHSIGEKLIKYNQEYFSEISLNQKLDHCLTIWRLTSHSIPGYDLEWKIATMKFDDFPDIKQFILERIKDDNKAGVRLRNIYGLIKANGKLIHVKGLMYNTPQEEIDRLTHLAQNDQLPQNLILDSNVVLKP